MGIERLREEEKMEEASEHRGWDGLIPDALGLIFSKVSLPERLSVILKVCKSWAKAVSNPHCWREIDLLQCTYHRPQPLELLERMVKMLVARSCGSLSRLSVYGLQSDSVFFFTAQNTGLLRTLMIPESEISNSIMRTIAGSLSSVGFLDLSYCMKISARGLELIGKNCKLQEGLSRQMHMWDTIKKPPRDDEAMAIASTMPNLKHLEIGGHSVTTEGVSKILGACSKLQHLRLSKCDRVQAQNLGLTRSKFPKLTVWGPHSSDHFDGEGRRPWESMERECKEMYMLSSEVVPEASDYYYYKAAYGPTSEDDDSY